MRPQVRHWARIGLPLLSLCLALFLILVPTNLPLRAAGAFALTCLLPGVLLGEILFDNDETLNVVERLLLYLGLGYVSMGLGTLVLHYIPGPLSQRLMLAFYGIFIVALLAFKSNTSTKAGVTWHFGLSQKTAACLIGLILLASFFRFTNLGYSEFQGDEGRALLRAAEVLQGHQEVLFLHKKGPIEILLPAALYASMERITEATARFPFAAANLAAVIALFALGRRLFDMRAALLAMLIMTIDGFSIGFSRIVQYQSIVVLMTLLALFCIYRWYQTDGQQSSYLLAGAAFTGIAFLAHYEGFFILPGALYMVWHVAKKQDWTLGQVAQHVGIPILLGCIIVGIFYLPFALHPNFSETWEYLTERRVGVGDGIPYNNITDFFWRTSYYNASYYPMLMGILLLASTLFILLRTYRKHLARMSIYGLGVVWLLIILFPSWWQFGSVNLSVVVFLVTAATLFHAPLSMEGHMLTLWFGSASLLYFFLMIKVHTHYYVALIPWSLIAAQTLSTGWGWLRPRWKTLSRVTVVLGTILCLLCTHYVYIVFVRHSIEYLHNYPAAKPAIYWTPFDEPPQGGYFGFPYRTAWKAIGGMYDAGILQGTYDSNQKERVTNWYTRGAMRCPQGDYFIIARDVEDPHAIIPGVIDGEYMPAMEILREGEPQLWIFKRDYKGPLQHYDYATYAADFDQRLSAPVFRVGAPLDDIFEPPHNVDANFGKHFQLLGWELDPIIVAQGDKTLLTLYWRTLRPTPANYHVFVHVGEKDTIAHEDSVPRCGQHPTYRWEQGEGIVDHYLLEISPETSLGVYPIRMGMYDFMTKERLTIQDAKGHDMDSLLLTHVRIGKPQVQRPDIAHTHRANLGDKVHLLGYDLPDTQLQAGDDVSLTLYWECQDAMEMDYTVFVHLLGPDGEIYGQRDSFPLDGRLPTTFWVPQEIVSDSYNIHIADDAPEGPYSLAIGMYDVHSGMRLPVTGVDGTPLSDDQILLSEVLHHE